MDAPKLLNSVQIFAFEDPICICHDSQCEEPAHYTLTPHCHWRESGSSEHHHLCGEHLAELFALLVHADTRNREQ